MNLYECDESLLMKKKDVIAKVLYGYEVLYWDAIAAKVLFDA